MNFVLECNKLIQVVVVFDNMVWSSTHIKQVVELMGRCLPPAEQLCLQCPERLLTGSVNAPLTDACLLPFISVRVSDSFCMDSMKVSKRILKIRVAERADGRDCHEHNTVLRCVLIGRQLSLFMSVDLQLNKTMMSYK